MRRKREISLTNKGKTGITVTKGGGTQEC